MCYSNVSNSLDTSDMHIISTESAVPSCGALACRFGILDYVHVRSTRGSDHDHMYIYCDLTTSVFLINGLEHIIFLCATCTFNNTHA